MHRIHPLLLIERRLTRSQWDDIVSDLLDGGMTIVQAAETYGVSAQAISDYLKRNRPYAHREYKTMPHAYGREQLREESRVEQIKKLKRVAANTSVARRLRPRLLDRDLIRKQERKWEKMKPDKGDDDNGWPMFLRRSNDPDPDSPKKRRLVFKRFYGRSSGRF